MHAGQEQRRDDRRDRHAAGVLRKATTTSGATTSSGRATCIKFANALITAGDAASAADAVNWLFNVDIDPSTGRFPQNAFVSRTSRTGDATQMDEQAMPIILAYRLGPVRLQPVVAEDQG